MLIISLGNDRGHASRKEHAGQGYNEWLNVHISYKKSCTKVQIRFRLPARSELREPRRSVPAPSSRPASCRAMATEGTNADIMPPVIITVVMPTPITIRPALEVNRFKKFWVFCEALLLKYDTANGIHNKEQYDRDQQKGSWSGSAFFSVSLCSLLSRVHLRCFFWAMDLRHFAKPGD